MMLILIHSIQIALFVPMGQFKLHEVAYNKHQWGQTFHQYHVSYLLSVAAQHSSQSPVSLTSDASSPRPYVSPRNGTPQSSQKSLLTTHPGSIVPSQTRVTNTRTKNMQLCYVPAVSVPLFLCCFFPFSLGDYSFS